MPDNLAEQIAELRERVAVVETKVDTIPEMNKKLDDILEMTTKYKGFIGGVVLVFTGIMISVKAGWEAFTHFGK